MDQGHQNFIRIPASAGLTSKDQRSPVDVFVNEDVHPRNGPANGSVETAPLPVNEETEPINPSSRTGKPEKKPNCNEAIVTVEPVVPTVAHCDMKLGSAAVNPLLMPNAVVTEDVASVAVEERAPRRPAHLSQEEPPNQSSAVRSYDIRIKILHGTETTKSMVSLDSITKSAIFDKAHSIYSQVACQHNPEQTGWKQESKFQLLSVEVDGLFVDLSKFDSEDLTFWIQTIFEDGASHVHG